MAKAELVVKEVPKTVITKEEKVVLELTREEAVNLRILVGDSIFINFDEIRKFGYREFSCDKFDEARMALRNTLRPLNLINYDKNEIA